MTLATGRFRLGLTDAGAIAQVLWAATHGLVALHITKGGDDWLEWNAIEDSTALMVDALLHGMLRPEESLHYFEQMTLTEIAAIEGLPEGTVKSRLAYGLAALRTFGRTHGTHT